MLNDNAFLKNRKSSLTDNQKRGGNTSLLLCIGKNMLFFVKNFSSKIARNPSIYKV